MIVEWRGRLLETMNDRVNYEKIAEAVEINEEGGNHSPAPAALSPDRQYLPLNHQKYQGIAEAKGYKQGEEYSGNRLLRVHYSHEAMIDIIIAEPTISQNDLAKRFGRSVGWISIVMGSDAFQAALAKRRDDLMDPEYVATIDEKLKGLALQSMKVISDRLAMTQSSELAVKALDISSKALGFGARSPSVTNNNFVVAIPPKIENAEDWAAAHAKRLPQIENDSGS